MVKTIINLDFLKFRKLVDQLNMREKLILLRKLEKDTWRVRFGDILNQIDEKLQKYRISQKEIDKIVNKSRQKHYEKSSNRH